MKEVANSIRQHLFSTTPDIRQNPHVYVPMYTDTGIFYMCILQEYYGSAVRPKVSEFTNGIPHQRSRTALW